MKRLNIKLIPLAVIVLLALPLSSQAGVKTIAMNSMLLENQSQDLSVEFVVDSQMQSDEADIHGNCAENPQMPGDEPYDPIRRLEKNPIDDIWDNWHSPNSSSSPTNFFLASSPPYNRDNNNNKNNDKDRPSSGDSEKIPGEDPDTPVTPEPATLLIIGSALVAVPAIRRFRGKK